MEDKLDFSLPDKRQKGSTVNKVTIVLLLVLILLTTASLLVTLSGRQPTDKTGTDNLSAEQTRQLATKLAQRNLYEQAAKMWKDYLSTAELTDVERAKALFQIGTLLEKASFYAEAIDYFYRSEVAAKLDELESQINTHIKDCFEKLGKFSALRYELMDRTSLKADKLAGSKIVAEIGAEKITEADLDARIENSIENQLAPMAAFMTAEQLSEQKKKMLEQYKGPQAKQQFLQSWVAQEILYRQALEESLAEKPEVKKLLEELARGLLSQQLMNQQLADKIHITETDLETYYQANKDKYVEPAKAKISHILVDDEQKAKDLIARLKGGENFGELAKEFSKDENTKETGGQIDADVVKDAYHPVIGESEELNEKIFAVEAPTLLDEPFKTEKGWEIIKIEQKQPQRQKSFDGVRQQIFLALTNRKRQDVQAEFIQQMMDKHNVIIHTSALAGPEQRESEQNTSPAKE